MFLIREYNIKDNIPLLNIYYFSTKISCEFFRKNYKFIELISPICGSCSRGIDVRTRIRNKEEIIL